MCVVFVFCCFGFLVSVGREATAWAADTPANERWIQGRSSGFSVLEEAFDLGRAVANQAPSDPRGTQAAALLATFERAERNGERGTETLASVVGLRVRFHFTASFSKFRLDNQRNP